MPAERLLARVRDQIGPDRFARYFENRARLDLTDGRLEVIVPTGFLGNLIVRRFGEMLRSSAAAESAGSVELRIRVDGEGFGGEAARQERARPAPARVAARRPGARRRVAGGADEFRHSLDEYVVGESNKLAYAAAQKLAEPGCPRSFSPLCIHGACGLGKTHLLQGLAARFRQGHPHANVRYTTAEAFTNEYVAAVRSGKLDTFRRTYRGLDLLCIDDAQFLANKHATQCELLHTFDTMDLDGARVVLASDDHPRQVEKLSQALVSRFMSGMVVRLDPPEPELRERIVRALAERRGLRLDPAAAAFIAGQSAGGAQPASVRELIGALTRVEAVGRLMPDLCGPGESIGLTLVRKALGQGEPGAAPDGLSLGRRAPRRPIKVAAIMEEVCRTLGVEHADLLGRGRHKRVVLARSLTAYLSRMLTTLSFPEIARAMGRPNHSTIVTAVGRVQGQIDRDQHLDTELSVQMQGHTLRSLSEHLRQNVLRSAPR